VNEATKKIRVRGRGGFWSGLASFFDAIYELFRNAELRKWFVRAGLRSLGLATLILILLLLAGAWGLWKYLGGDWVGGVATLLWVAVVIFMSGYLTVMFMNIFVVIVSGEKGLALALEGHDTRMHKAQRSHRWRELRAFLASLVISIFCWPLLLIPFVMPVGILIFAWAMGHGAAVSADRIHEEATGESLLLVHGELSFGNCMALGLLPAIASLIPIVGWLFLPILQVAGFLSVRRELYSRTSAKTHGSV
jgi:hypothetical protein